jgi:hypothetical protein
MKRVTLQLPDPVYERIKRASRETGRSLNQVMIDALRVADLSSKPPEGATPQEILNWALRDVRIHFTDEDEALMAQVFGDDSDIPDMTTEELWEIMPKLPPAQWLSQAVIDDREDRF